jgi:hypothetical protein
MLSENNYLADMTLIDLPQELVCMLLVRANNKKRARLVCERDIVNESASKLTNQFTNLVKAGNAFMAKDFGSDIPCSLQ